MSIRPRCGYFLHSSTFILTVLFTRHWTRPRSGWEG